MPRPPSLFTYWRAPATAAILAALIGGSVCAAESDTMRWLEGKHATGDWLGARTELAEHGVEFEGRWRGVYYGVLASENGQAEYFDQELAFCGSVDFRKLTHSAVLEGLTGFIETRWRDPAEQDNPNESVLAEPMFNPSPYESGVGWRLVSFGLRYRAPAIAGRKDFLTLTGGWLRPVREFLTQPLSLNFLNTAIQSAKGLGGNIPFSSSFSTWGGTLEVKLLDWQYTKVGLFMSYPEATFGENHGLMMSGYPSDPARNSEFFIGETGVTPQIGPDKLPGKYAFGGYFYGDPNGKTGGSKYGFYWQADQMLCRENRPDAPSPDEGLRAFSMLTFAPPYNNRWPLYAQAGLVYEGLSPTRNKDLAQIAVAAGREANVKNKTGTLVLEGGYRVQVNRWAFLQPYAQYLAQPDGGQAVGDAVLLGVFAGLNF
ncbi:MAG: carbohydrate porin [Chthoniobacterales bacterium]